MASKLEEADRNIKEAEKCMKTSLLKWKPDLDGAIEYYTKAALIYRNAKKLHEGAELYKKIAHLNLQRGSAFHAAKAFEIASLMHRDAKEFHKMADLVYEAGKLLRESGSPDSATLVYEKASKSLEDYLPERAAEFYESSSEACEAEDKHLQAAEQAGQAARMWTRMRRYNEAERLLRKQISFVLDSSTSQQNMNSITSTAQICGRVATTLILLKLHQGDEIAAGKVYAEAMQRWNFASTDDAGPVFRLLSAIEQCDAEGAAAAIRAPTFKLLENDYVRLIKEIKFLSTDQLAGITQSSSSTCNNAASSAQRQYQQDQQGFRQKQLPQSRTDVCSQGVANDECLLRKSTQLGNLDPSLENSLTPTAALAEAAETKVTTKEGVTEAEEEEDIC